MHSWACYIQSRPPLVDTIDWDWPLTFIVRGDAYPCAGGGWTQLSIGLPNHYLVCMQHWVAPGWCQQWRQGKLVHFAQVWFALLALPTPPTIPRPSTLTRGSCLIRAPPAGWRPSLGRPPPPPAAAIAANNANAADPVEAPSPASNFMQAIGVLHALGCLEFQKLCVCMRVFACL